MQRALSFLRYLPARSDLTLPAVIALVGQIEVWVPEFPLSHMVGPKPVNAAGYLLAALALLWRRRAPIGVLAFIATVSSVQYLLIGASEGLGSFLPPLISLYSVGRHSKPQSLIVAGPLGLLGVAVHELRDPIFELGGPAITFWLVLAAAWPLGQAFRTRQLHADRLADRATLLEREREVHVRDAIAQERNRIARELHDVVGHGLSVIVVQALAAMGKSDRDGGTDVRDRLDAIEETARQSLAEMRRLVGLLDRDEDPSRGPQPRVAEIEGLIEQTRAAGLPVEFTVEGTEASLSPGLDLTVYRIVQEALTNILKHAGPTDAFVTIRYSASALEVEVADNGAGGITRDENGRGLIGMRERVSLYEGEFHAGPRPEGGYLVQARLPIREKAP
ncbi:MAG: sensor histidine kinase [Actinobacteria bacterium]|nr:sensor histidine kinase [Actinomycetota bacterium]